MILIEPFAGLGAYSLKAMALEYERTAHRKCRHEPPISRMGNKAFFVPNVLKAWGLNRVRWSSVWMNDLDPVCHLFHLIYASSELRDAVARRIWSWVPCPVCLPDVVEEALSGHLKPTRDYCLSQRPAGIVGGCVECNDTGTQDCRRLWERIRKEPVPMDLVEAASAGLLLQGRAFGASPVTVEHKKGWRMTGDNRSVVVGYKSEEMGAVVRDDIASRLESLPSGFATLAHVAASAVFLQSRSFSLKPVSIRDGWEEHGYKDETCIAGVEGSWNPRDETATRLDSLPGPGGMSLRITRQDAALCLPTGDASECLVVADPPYVGTSGYANDATRTTVLSLARAWHDAGALVLIHEAVGLAGELGKGWLERPATVLRGRKSTFWGEGGEREWLTMNRPPVWWPEAQTSLF